MKHWHSLWGLRGTKGLAKKAKKLGNSASVYCLMKLPGSTLLLDVFIKWKTRCGSLSTYSLSSGGNPKAKVEFQIVGNKQQVVWASFKV